MSFATLEQRTNAAVMRRLANARGYVQGAQGGDGIPLIFDQATLAAMGGEITAAAPRATAWSADCADFQSDRTRLTINGASYILRDLQPDGTGFTLLILETA